MILAAPRAPAEPLDQLETREALRELLAEHGICVRAGALRERHDVTPADASPAADHRPLVREHRVGDAPPFVDRPEPARVGNGHVREEHLVEVRHAVDLAQRPDLDAGRVHVEEERGDALVLRRIEIRAREQEAPIAVMRARRPDLLAVHDPLLAIGHGACAQPGQVRTGARLREQLAPHVLAAQHRPEETRLLLLGAPTDDRGSGHRNANGEHARRDIEA